MAGRKAYDENTRAAVMSALLEGQSITEVSKKYKISRATVSRIRGKISDQLKHDETQKEDRIGRLLGQYVECNLATLKAQSVFFRDEKWLSRQHASELAVLHGVIADKTIRILEAAEAASEEGEEE